MMAKVIKKQPGNLLFHYYKKLDDYNHPQKKL